MTDPSRTSTSGPPTLGLYTTGEVEARTGVAATTLRQWERRYGIPRPQRSPGGYRLYSALDLARIGFLQAQLASGLSISRAAELAHTQFGEDGPATAPPRVAALLGALRASDHDRAAGVLAQAHAELPVEAVLTGVIEPTLCALGELWASGEITVAHEHQASAFLRARVMALLDAAGQGRFGPTLVAACGPGERHEIGLLMLVTVLRRHGLRVHALGADTPLADLCAYARGLGASALLLSVNTAPALKVLEAQLEALDGLGLPVYYGGAAFNAAPEEAARLGGLFAGENAVSAAEHIVRALQAPGATS